MKRVNILYTVWGLTHGGAEHFVLDVIKNLDKDKYNIVIFSDRAEYGSMEKDFEENGAKVVYSKWHRFKHPIKYIKQLKSLIEEEKIDIIHANDDFNMIFPIIAKRGNKKVRFIAHAHTTRPKFTKIRQLSFLAKKIIPNIIARQSDVRLACSEDAGKVFFGKKYFEVVPNGIELEKTKYDIDTRETIRKELGIEKEDIVIGHIGRMSNEKNHIFMVDIIDELKNKCNAKYKLVFVGDGVLEKEIKEQVKKRGLEDRVFFLGSRKNAVDFLNAFDVFIFPSIYEGLGIALIEAQFNGLKCFASNNVPRTAGVKEDTEFLPIDSAKYWADKIKNLTNLERSLPDEKYRNYYSIKTTVGQLERKYNLYNTKEKISIIVPMFNAEKNIEACVKSLIKQTYKNIEIIIVDDGSTDNSKSIVSKIASSEKRVKVFSKVNEGPGEARLYGVNRASGEIIMFVDADDFLSKDASEKIIDAFTRYDVDAVRFQGTLYPINKDVQKIKTQKYGSIWNHNKILEAIALGDDLSSMCFQAYRKKCFEGILIPKHIKYCEDYLINQKIYENNRRIVIIPDTLYFYRINLESTTRTEDLNVILSNLRDRIYSCNNVIELIDNSMLDENIKEFARGFQIERIRRDSIKIFRTYGNDSYEILEKIYKEDAFRRMLNNISENDVSVYIKSLSFTKKLKTAKIIKAIYHQDKNDINIYAKKYRFQYRIQRGMKK